MSEGFKLSTSVEFLQVFCTVLFVNDTHFLDWFIIQNLHKTTLLTRNSIGQKTGVIDVNPYTISHLISITLGINNGSVNIC